jgi:hypothetical protein
MQQQVPGLEVRCLLANVGLLYLVAGLWKWTSPMWRDGTALYVGLQTPVSRAPDFWTPGWLPLLMVASWAALVLEPLLPAMFLLPTHHRVKWVLFAGAATLHVGILIMLKIPYANAVLLAVSVLTFRDEIMRFLQRASPLQPSPPVRSRVGAPGVVAVGFIVLLSAAMAGEVAVAPWRQPPRELAAATRTASDDAPLASDPGDGLELPGLWSSGHNPFYAPLWAIGVAQSYRLFDWVDDRNWDIRYEVIVTPPEGPSVVEPADRLFGDSIRHVLLQSYVHGVRWGLLTGSDRTQFRYSTLARYANGYCADHTEDEGTVVDVFALVRRITRESSVHRQRDREHLMTFECHDEAAVLTVVSEAAG